MGGVVCLAHLTPVFHDDNDSLFVIVA